MTDSFEKWIKGMDDGEFEDWLDGTHEVPVLDEKGNKMYDAYGNLITKEIGFSSRQEDKALNIREPLTDQEEQEQVSEQVSTVERINVPQEVYDNRDLRPIRKTVTIDYSEATHEAKIIEQKPTIQPQIDTQKTAHQIIREVQQSRPQQRNRIIRALSNFLARFRRRRQ